MITIDLTVSANTISKILFVDDSRDIIGGEVAVSSLLCIILETFETQVK